MKKSDVDSHIPEFYRQAQFMAGKYLYTDECNPDSKYFRYQHLSVDATGCRKSGSDPQKWRYSYFNRRQKRFRSLINAGVLNRDVANYLEWDYWCRTNMFFIGGDDKVRRSLMQAVVDTRPELNIVKHVEELHYLSADELDGIKGWGETESKLCSRNDVLLYDGMKPTPALTSALMEHSVHHIVLAGFKEATQSETEKFRPKEREDFVSLTIRLDDVKLRSGRTVCGVTEIKVYEEYYNGGDKGIRWHRVNGKLTEIHSEIMY